MSGPWASAATPASSQRDTKLARSGRWLRNHLSRRFSVVCVRRFQKKTMAVCLIHGCFGLSDVRPASFAPLSHLRLRPALSRTVECPLFLPERAGASVGPAGEGPVEVEGGADQRQMSEGLREAAQGLAAGPGLLGVQPDVV